MIYVIVENNVVINRTKADQPLAANWIQSDVAQIGWIYDPDTQTLSELLPDIESLRFERREYLKAERDSVIDADINNVQVGRITDRENVQGTLANWDLLGLGESIKWVMADNSVQLLSKADLQAVFMGYAIRKFQCFDAYDQSLTALYNATTAEEIMAVTFNFGE